MVYFSSIFALLAAILVIYNIRRKKRIIGKISRMSMDEKYEKLNQLTEPFGYIYNNCQDIFSTSTDAWQKDFGYTAVYDKLAPYRNVITDCEPIYFYYNGKTWLIELWKGQYGINIGCEIGIYNVDRIVPGNKLHKTLFQGVTVNDMLPMSLHMLLGKDSVARLSKRHWWLTSYRMGTFCRPAKLAANISLTFPDKEMLDAFVHAALNLGYSQNEMYICGYQIFFTFDKPFTRTYGVISRLFSAIFLLRNLFFCWVFRIVTRPFCLTVDKLLYLYFYIPFGFRHMIRLKRFKKIGRRKD